MSSSIPWIPGNQPGGTPTTAEQLNGSSLWKVADTAALKAIDTSDLTIYANDRDIICRHTENGFYRLDTGSSQTADDEFVIQPTAGSGRWLLENKSVRYNVSKKMTASGIWSAFEHTTDVHAKITIDMTTASNGVMKTYSGASLKHEALPGGVYTRIIDVDGDLSFESAGRFENISGSSYDSKRIQPASGTYPWKVNFKPDGLKMFVLAQKSSYLVVEMYTLSTAWDVSTATYVSSVNIEYSNAGTAGGLYFKKDGTKFYAQTGGTNSIRQYNMGTAWDISTATYYAAYSPNTQDIYPRDIYISDNGTKMWYLGGSNKTIYQYTLSTAFNVNTASYDSVSFSVESQTGSNNINTCGLSVSEDRLKFWVLAKGGVIYEYNFANPVSGASYTGLSYNSSAQSSTMFGVFVDIPSLKMAVVGSSTRYIYQYSTITPYSGTTFIDVDITKKS